jgi:pimeloyl-ACP methyl ester carboxylesterase
MDARLLRQVAEHSVRLEKDGRWGFKFDPRWFGVPPRPAPDLSQVNQPLLLLRGEESELLSPEGATAFTDELSNARLVTVARAGHHVLLDQPRGTLAPVLGFLNEDRILAGT